MANNHHTLASVCQPRIEPGRIEVVSGQYAWNEDIPGAELVPGEGKATPMPRAVQERLIRLWASPQGAPKAALAGAGLDLTAMETGGGYAR